MDVRYLSSRKPAAKTLSSPIPRRSRSKSSPTLSPQRSIRRVSVALRFASLCLQEDVADRVVGMLRGAMRELEIGNPSQLSVDVGPVISEDAQRNIASHIETMRVRGHVVEQLLLPPSCQRGTFISPTIIGISKIADVEREVFGPVLHVMRYRREQLAETIDQINATGYGLTFGLHSRIDETIARVSSRIEAGNIYVNRNIIGAVVGVQPFGGCGLSGTGPKAGGPLYLGRLFARAREKPFDVAARPCMAARAYLDWLRAEGRSEEARRCATFMSRSLLGTEIELPGPVGERNMYLLDRRGAVAALAEDEKALLIQIGAILATGNRAIVQIVDPVRVLDRIPLELQGEIRLVDDWRRIDKLEAVLFDGPPAHLVEINKEVAKRPGPIVPVVTRSGGYDDYDLDRLVKELSISTNTAAAGGNASLMSIG